MADFSIRWSALEARKSYASPFGVTFIGDGDEALGGIAVNGSDLLYYRHFQQAVLRLAGEVFCVDVVDVSPDPQLAWLDVLGVRLPSLETLEMRPESYLDERAKERRFRFVLEGFPGGDCFVDSTVLADYQELQAAVAHLSGRLYRHPIVEAVEDPERRRSTWLAALRSLAQRPSSDDRLSEAWPW